MEKYGKYPDLYEIYSSIKSGNEEKSKIKKELINLKESLHEKEMKHQMISSNFNKIKKEKERELKLDFDSKLMKAKYEKDDVNNLYDSYQKELEQLKQDYELKKQTRIDKSRLEIDELKSKINELKNRINEIDQKNKELNAQLKSALESKKDQIDQENVRISDELRQAKQEAIVNIKQAKDEYNENYQKLLNEWSSQHSYSNNYNSEIKKFRNKRKVKMLKDENDKLNYELYLKASALEIERNNKIKAEKQKVKDKELELRYNKGKGDPITFRTTLDKFAMGAGKIANWKFLVAIKNSFFSLMPLIIVGAAFILLNNVVLSPANGSLLNLFAWKVDGIQILARLRSIGGNVWNGSYAFFGFLIAGAIGYHLAPYYKINQWAAAVVSFVSFLIMSPSFWGNLGVFGIAGMFTSMIIGSFATVFFAKLIKNEKLKIKMPDSVPDGVAKSFNTLIPYGIVFTVFGIISFGITQIGEVIGPVKIGKDLVVNIVDLNSLISIAIQKPLVDIVTGNIGGMIVVIFVWQLLWFMGIHGSSILSPVIEPIQLDAIANNQKLASEGIKEGLKVFTNPFMNSFIYMGGTGGTLGLIIAIFIFSRRSDYRAMAKVSLIPAIFCINEPLLFGLPIVLNPVLFIPFVFGPIIVGVLAYLATISGLLPYTTVIVPWTTPPIIAGTLTVANWRGTVVSIINLAILIGIYTPFVLIANKLENRELLNRFDKKVDNLESNNVEINAKTQTA